MTSSPTSISTVIVEEDLQLSLEDLSQCCECRTEWLVELVREGALEPLGSAPQDWRFSGASLRRARTAWHLARDLQVNAAGAALALELLDEIHALKLQLRIGT